MASVILPRSTWDTVSPGPFAPIDYRGASRDVCVHHTAGHFVYPAKGKPGARWLGARRKLSSAARRIVERWVRADRIVAAAERAEIRATKALHGRVPGLDNRDIAYHVGIMPSGRAYHLRDLDRHGSHARGGNGDIGVVFFGNYEVQKPTAAALATYHAVIAELGSTRQYGHYRINPTACPGRHLKAALPGV